MPNERQLVKGHHVFHHGGHREWRPKGVAVMTSGSPITRESFSEYLTNENQTGSVHALVDATGITFITPPDSAAVGAEPDGALYDCLKIVACEPTGKTINENLGLATKISRNLAICIFHLCRNLAVDPAKLMIQFVGKANDYGIWMPPERPAAKRARKRANLSPLFGSSQSVNQDGADYYVNLVKTEVMELRVQIAHAYAEVNSMSPDERPVDAIGVGDVVLFLGGDLYKSRGASSALILDAALNYGVVRAIYPGSKHCYEIVFPQGTYCVNKSTVQRSALGHIG